MDDLRKELEAKVNRAISKRIPGVPEGALCRASDLPKRAYIKTGIWEFDRFIGGGISDHAVYHLRGVSGTGKTTATMYACKGFIEAGIPVIWVCSEGKFPSEYAQEMGVDTDQVTAISNLPAAEDYLDTLKMLLYNDEKKCALNIYGLVVIDSVASMPPSYEVEKTADEGFEHQVVGTQAKFVAKFGRVFIGGGLLGNTSVILINQMRDKIEQRAPGGMPSPGGHAIKHYPLMSVKFSTLSDGKIITKGTDHPVGNTVFMEMEANKTGRGATPGQKSSYRYYYRTDTTAGWVDNDYSKLTYLRERGIIREEPGSRFVVPLEGAESYKVHGWDATVSYIKDNNLLDYLEGLLDVSS